MCARVPNNMSHRERQNDTHTHTNTWLICGENTGNNVRSAFKWIRREHFQPNIWPSAIETNDASDADILSSVTVVQQSVHSSVSLASHHFPLNLLTHVSWTPAALIASLATWYRVLCMLHACVLCFLCFISWRAHLHRFRYLLNQNNLRTLAFIWRGTKR